MTRVKGGAPNRPSEKVMLAEIRLRERTIRNWGVVATGVCGALIFGGMWSPAHELAGQDTKITVSIAVTIAITLVISNGVVALYANHQRKRANESEARSRNLSRDVKELQRRLKDNKLPTDVSR